MKDPVTLVRVIEEPKIDRVEMWTEYGLAGVVTLPRGYGSEVAARLIPKGFVRFDGAVREWEAA